MKRITFEDVLELTMLFCGLGVTMYFLFSFVGKIKNKIEGRIREELEEWKEKL